MPECDHYNPDNVFNRFKVIEFPVSFVGLATVRYLDVETNLARDAYLKTTYDGCLMKFEEAREISASHRAFFLAQINDKTVKITFKPTNECLSNTKSHLLHDNKFVFDLRLIKVNGARCCNNEFHSEIGRYYISGEYEYCKLSHYPKVIHFGNVDMNTETTKHVRIKNESRFNATKIESIKVTGFDVLPCKIVIPPNSTKRIKVTTKPTSLVMKTTLIFEVRNPHSMFDDTIVTNDQNENDNCLPYCISCKVNVIYKTKKTNLMVESMHKLNEPDIRYTYVDEKSLNQQMERRKEAFKHLQICKSSYAKKTKIEQFSTGKDKCQSYLSLRPRRLPENFCKPIIQRINTYALFDVWFLPYSLDFGRIATQTYGEQELIIKNKSRYDITILFQRDQCILYSDKKLATMSLKLNSFGETKLKVLCLGYSEGNFHGTFDYLIDNKFSKKHKYALQVGNPVLRIQENVIKFGMITSDSFITSVPVRIYNDFNIPVDYKWDALNTDVPFDIIPSTGLIPEHSCRMCDVIYICKLTKTKTHEIDLISKGNTNRVIPVELNVVTRKLTVKFLQPAIVFKDVALNIETIERVKLENSSREIASFIVLEPLIPGLRVEPMSGNIRPKMVITFEIILQISCVLEFNLDVVVRINNKENVAIQVSGNVVEPKITIQPKNIFLNRIPCGMVTYVPVTFQNSGSVRTLVEVLDTGDENIFDVYTIAQGNERQRILEFFVDSWQSKTVFIKVHDLFRREYDIYIPFKINGLLGPPNEKASSLELHSYIGEYESLYENNIRVKIKSLNKDINYCRIVGVITVPWVEFSVDKFEIEYVPNGNNTIEFTMKNISKYYLYVTVVISKLSPIFSLNVDTGEIEFIVNENNIKFELCREAEVAFTLKFHPKMHGRYVSTAILFLDKQMVIPYYNLTFIGNRVIPVMTPSSYRVLFPPCLVGISITRYITIKMGFVADIDQFSCSSKDEPNLYVKFHDCEIVNPDNEELYTLLTMEIKVSCDKSYARRLILTINHECGSSCEIEITFYYTKCTLTLHGHSFIAPENDPYPYYPENYQTELYNYMETCTQFLEKWMFQQGFRRDLYPEIPDTFHAISTFLSSQNSSGTKSKGISVTYLSFMRRIAGPLMKYIHKASAHGVDESFKCVKEIHDTYKEILNLLRSRGSDLWNLQAKFLLSYDQFVIYTDFVTPRCNADILLTQELLGDIKMFNRLSKQSWIDVILQCYKVFIMDSCFFDCVCTSNKSRDINQILIDWFNAQIILQHKNLGKKDIPAKGITNLTTDLADGIALASALLNYCPFLSGQFAMFSDLKNENREAGIINNACLIIEAMNLLRFYFPLNSTDFLQPNFLQMLFLSIHLYVVLPMFHPRDIIKFIPPLLRSSTRNVGVYSATQESLTFNFVLLNNYRNNFAVEKVPSAENGKKMFLSVTYTANFVAEENCILLVHGYNKTRIFDTYMIFLLEGGIGALNPVKKCKVTGPLYRPNKVDIPVSSPFMTTATFIVDVTDHEPFIPVKFENSSKPKFYVRRLNLIDREIVLAPTPKDSAQDHAVEHKIYLQLMCLSTPVGNSWIWFRSDIGEFFIRVTTQPRWDLALDTLQAKFDTWPVDPCSCGEACECYRTTILQIPHRNDLMIKALRYSLFENASNSMMHIFENLIETTTGKQILGMLLEEGGTNMADVKHILRSEVRYRITSKALLPRLDRVILAHHTSVILPLPVTLPTEGKSEKYTVTFTSDCGMDIRTYRIIFVQSTSAYSMQAC